MRTILRQLLVLACFVGGWSALLFGLSRCGVEVRKHAEQVARLVERKVHPAEEEEKEDVPDVGPGQRKSAEITTKESKNPLIPKNLRLLVPPQVYAVVGTEMSIYLDNLVMTQHPDQIRLEVREAGKEFGHTERRRWTITPAAKDVGEHVLNVTVKDWRGKEVLGETKTTLVVSPENAGAEAYLRLLIVGDSLTHSTFHINELTRSLSRPGNPKWKLLGTNTTPQALPGVFHEGYGGWTWHCFLTWNEPGSAKRRYRDRSPFLYPTANGKVKLDVARYFKDHCGGEPPNIVLFELGINDVFCLQPEKPDVVEGHITFVLGNADKLIAGFRKAAPEMPIAILLPPQLTIYDRIYQDVYALEFNRWRVRQNTQRYLERASAHFAGREKDRIYTIPAFVNYDAIDGYPIDDPAHPNEFGCKQYAASIHAWIKHWYTMQGKVPMQLSRVK